MSNIHVKCVGLREAVCVITAAAERHAILPKNLDDRRASLGVTAHLQQLQDKEIRGGGGEEGNIGEKERVASGSAQKPKTGARQGQDGGTM